MNPTVVGYWILTVLASLALTGSGLFNLSLAPEIVAAMDHLGFPEWFPRWLGAWKVAGAIVLLAPGLPRLKEWATAGFVISMSSASVAHIATGDPLAQAVPPLVLLALVLGSYALRPASRRLAGGVL